MNVHSIHMFTSLGDLSGRHFTPVSVSMKQPAHGWQFCCTQWQNSIEAIMEWSRLPHSSHSFAAQFCGSRFNSCILPSHANKTTSYAGQACSDQKLLWVGIASQSIEGNPPALLSGYPFILQRKQKNDIPSCLPKFYHCVPLSDAIQVPVHLHCENYILKLAYPKLFISIQFYSLMSFFFC